MCVAIAITLLAFTLRFLGIRLGLPYFHHWDEGWVTENTASILNMRDWRPHTYQYGAPPSLIAALVVRAATVLAPNHVFDSSDGALLRLIGRVITIVISSSGAFAIYVTARFALPGDRGARLRAVYAALLYATASELITHGRYAATDANLVGLTAWSLACGALFVRGARLRWAVGSLFFAALAVAFKLTALPTLVIPLGLLLIRPPAPVVSRAWLLLTLPFVALVFFALNPHVLIHWNDAAASIQTRVNQTVRGGLPEFLIRNPGMEALGAECHAILFQAFQRWPWASVCASGAGLYGLVLAWSARSRVVMVGTGQALLLLLGFALTSRAFLFRNYLASIPIVCVGFGFAMERAHTWMGRWRGAAIAHVALAGAFAALFLAVPLYQAVRAEQLSVDARTRALDWVAAQPATKPVTVACTPAVIADVMGSREDLRPTLARPGLVIRKNDVETAAQAASTHADYILVVSAPDRFGLGDVWPFFDVVGYRLAQEFDCNPYEHNFAITPPWGGRFNVRVLERARQ